jgi:hypothetical protein
VCWLPHPRRWELAEALVGLDLPLNLHGNHQHLFSSTCGACGPPPRPPLEPSRCGDQPAPTGSPTASKQPFGTDSHSATGNRSRWQRLNSTAIQRQRADEDSTASARGGSPTSGPCPDPAFGRAIAELVLQGRACAPLGGPGPTARVTSASARDGRRLWLVSNWAWAQ